MVEGLCVRYRTTPWDVEANATTASLRHIRILGDGETTEQPAQNPMEAMLANMSSVIEEPIG